MIRRTLFSAALLVLVGGVHPGAQLARPGESGVVMGHLHFNAPDAEAAREFWMALGGEAVTNPPLQFVQFSGVLIMLRDREPEGGTVGSVINHIGFNVRNLQASITRWEAAGIDVEPGGFDGQAWVTAPGDVRVEILENAEIDVPIRMHHVHWNVAAVPEMQAWYERAFGAVPGMRGRFVAADLPGVNLTFGEADDALTPTQGRALDHVGFESTDLQALIAHLESQGIALDSGYRQIGETPIAIAFLTDPCGTYIELTENLAP